MHTIRFCKLSEKNILVDFIRNHWNKNHSLVHSGELLDFQHLNKQNNRYNFIIAFNNKTKDFDAILGFIPLSQYDCEMQNDNIWLAIWKTKKEYGNGWLGLQLLLKLTSQYKGITICAIGISDIAFKLYKSLKYKMGILNHFFIKNNNAKLFNVAYFPDDTGGGGGTKQ